MKERRRGKSKMRGRPKRHQLGRQGRFGEMNINIANQYDDVMASAKGLEVVFNYSLFSLSRFHHLEI